MSVSSLASIVQNVERSFLLATDLSLRTIKCCSVVFGVTLRLLVVNISSTSAVNNKRRAYYQRLCHNLSRFGGDMLTTPSRGRSVDSSKISESRFLPTPSAFDVPARGVPVRILPCRLVRKNYNGLATRP